MAPDYDRVLADLGQRLDGLAVATGDAQYTVELLEEPAFLARDRSGAPCILFKLVTPPLSAASLVSTGLEFVIHASSRFSLHGEEEDAAIAALICRDERWRNEFLILCADAARAARANKVALATMQGAREFFKRWSALFREERPLSFEQKLGLWGELQVLKRLTPIDDAIEVWHGPEAATFDFGNNGVAVEVKSSTMVGRHVFSLEQLETPEATSLLVASLHVQVNPAGGTTVADEVNELLRIVNAPSALEEKLLSLGLQRSKVDTERFSLASLSFFAGDEVPRPREIDGGVDQVTFRADLSTIEALPEKRSRGLLARLTKPVAAKPTKKPAKASKVDG